MRTGIFFGGSGIVLLAFGFGLQVAAHLPEGKPPFLIPAAILILYGCSLLLSSALKRRG